jgi:methionyl-tRNA formyltransferase
MGSHAMIGNDDIFVLAANRPWSLEAFARHRAALPGTWRLATAPADLAAACAATPKPRMVFLPHWSWKIPETIIEHQNCVIFHMTDLPYGRGGSPLQHLILRGHRKTVLTALRASAGLDEGPVYLKRPLSLAGSAQEIFERASEIIMTMIATILRERPTPVPQSGEATRFARRRPEESVLPQTGEAGAIHDFIRMLDADGYPHAFVEHGALRIELRDAQCADGAVTATARITRKDAP